MYDVIIIGAGPAGITAGIYAARREMKTLIISSSVGGQLVWAGKIENYPGFSSIDNVDLIMKMQEQVKDLGVTIENKEVQQISKETDGSFVINTTTEKYKTKTVIIAMGLLPRRLAILGEEKFTGKGISYCANCDGPFYRDKTVAVIGGGNSALDAAEVLSKISKKVFLVHRKESFRGFESLIKKIKEKENIELLLNNEVKEISGSDKVEKIKIFNNKDKKEKEITIDGIFIEIGRIAHTDLVSNLVERDKNNQIIVNEKCETKTAGVFAAGDVTQVPFKQITIAQGQATIASLSAYQYLQLQEGKDVKTVVDRSY